MLSKIKSIYKNLFVNSPVLGNIYMLHRCARINPDMIKSNEHLKVSPEFLRNLIIKLKEDHIFVGLDEIVEIIHQKKKSKKKFIAFTFDDGYKDNFTHALPLFEEFEIPFSVFITPSFPDRKIFLWWYCLEEIILNNAMVELSDNKLFSCKSKAEKEKTFLDIRLLLLNFPANEIEERFKELFRNYDFSNEIFTENLCMNWDEIRALSQSKYCTIGSHTLSHYNLSKLSKDEMIDEIILGNRRLEEQIEKQVRHFAYPFGTLNEFGEREILEVGNSNFKSAYSAFGGMLRANHNNTMCLPRTFLGEFL